MPCDISKAERGYRLYDADGYSLQLPVPELVASMPLDDAVVALGWQLLGNSQRLAEQYRFNGRWKLLGEWLQQLVELRALLGSLGQAAPRASSRELRELLDMLIQDWRPRVEAGQDDEGCARPHRRSSPRNWVRPAGACCRSRRPSGCCNAAGPKAATPVAIARVPPSWANGCRTCWPKAKALQLPRYQQQPEDLAEQSPRMERMLVWLHLARGVLELPETDRLYGELAKLHEMARQPLDEAAREQRVEQAHRVWTLKARKLLENNGITLRKVEPRRQTTPGV